MMSYNLRETHKKEGVLFSPKGFFQNNISAILPEIDLFVSRYFAPG